ncbi:MAG TPA: hypothetical protein VGF12_13230 [Roseateles sp.]|uniref:hypothetical protein n=1 Tax=Roseateles sp. TaxID=1971397 RepID=UPI002EDAC41D
MDIDGVLREESRYLGRAAPQVGQQEPLTALCLSGGGIRSATFCLGVLQGLARRGGLRRFHYLSTVSGGGYIGSWLSAWIARAGLARVERELAGGHSQEPDPVRRLRAYTNYLSPVWGLSLDMLSLVSIFLRNLLLHWIVLVPLLTALLMAPRLQLALVSMGGHADAARICLAVAVALLVLAISYIASDLPATPVAAPAAAPRPMWIQRDQFILCCFLPLLGCAVLLSWTLAWDRSLLSAHGGYVVGAGALIHGASVFLGGQWRPGRGMRPRRLSPSRQALAGSAIVASGALGGAALYGLARFLPDLGGPAAAPLEARVLHASLVVPALLVTFWVGVTAYAGLTRGFTGEEDREWWARAAAWWLGVGVAWVLACLLVLELPRALLGLADLQRPAGAKAASLGTALLGALTAAAGFWSKSGPGLEKKVKSLADKLGSRALEAAALAFSLMLALALAYAASCTLRHADGALRDEVARRLADAQTLQRVWVRPEPKPGAPADPDWGRPEHAPLAVKALVSYEAVLDEARYREVLACGLALLAFAVLGSRAFGSNTFSLHSLYANRLVRAYLGASRNPRNPHHFTGFDADDNLRLGRLLRRYRPDRRLFHIVNTALNLTRPAGDRLEWQERKAASFTMSPLHCGSAALRGGPGSPPQGFVRTGRYGAPGGGLSLGRALGISGAAASPNMGYHSSPFVAFVMTVFNVRLGWWSPNPLRAFKREWRNPEPANAFQALWSEVSGASDAAGSFVYLSDGGHFENLGLYEMIRRRCERIVVVDATCDPRFESGDLQDAINKARVDFGVDIEFTTRLPGKPGGGHHAMATIRYPDGPGGPALQGELFYIKPVLSGDEPLDVLAFARSHASPKSPFPHQSTAEQFFDQSQFEAYRVLGLHSVLAALPGEDDWPDLQHLSAAGAVPPGGGGEPPDEGEPEKPSPPRSSAWLWTGAAGLGGALAITGSVALKPGSQVELKPGGQVDLSPYAQVRLVDPGPGGLPSSSTLGTVNELKQQIDQLSQQLSSQTSVLVTRDGPAVDLRRLEGSAASAAQSLQDMQANLDALRTQLHEDMEARRAAAERLNGAVWRMQRDLEAGQTTTKPAPR